MGLFHEAIVQLRGEDGPRQVPDARVAVVSSGGLTPSGVILLKDRQPRSAHLCALARSTTCPSG